MNCAKHKQAGQRPGDGRQQVHSPGNCANRHNRLDEFAQQGDEGITGWVSNPQNIGDKGVFRRVAINGRLRQGKQVAEKNDQQKQGKSQTVIREGR